MAVDERDNSAYVEHRRRVSQLLDAWEQALGSVARYDGMGGQAAMEDFFSAEPPPAITSDEYYGSMVAIQQIKTVMDAGAYPALLKVRT